METREGGERAIAEMNGQEFMKFRMVVKEAEERGSRPRSATVDRPSSSDSRSATRSQSDGRVGGGFGPRPGGGGDSFGADKKPAKKKKVQRQKPDKYSDGPRQTKMKKSRGGGGSKGWSDYDEDY